ncbi:dTDP-4-dehydrorhamnose reductase [Candidatus Azambacteria bacterium RIFCSPLOWO2_02_FULL_44_14]|uniref:dTDP-4-dehydrorhamnose reductase n=1 Tax=Candidatus Azambacteria bacterium RIFCSPLOWO2_02_FULL_44_14 TaxID=1797306 RepID=A0A1F5CC89_9BACT|nr:MAG: dTDP-4-dehydrorhamnose reductase [Candidatus Azambacteria bacterium RIFCSPLOWO2_02_FULL_44_14]
MKKILIIGSTGQLAFDLIRVLKGSYKIIPVARNDFDVVDSLGAEKFIKSHKPDIVINAAAYHKTEECELNPEKSFQVNAIGAYNVARAANEINARIIFFSTDYVFDGNKKFFTENDAPKPLNIWGASRLAGEILVRIANPNHYIIRTSWLFGVHRSSKGHNFVSLMLEKARAGNPIKVVNDQFGSPTYAYDLALKVKELISKRALSGIYHITNSGSCSWYEFAKKIFELTKVKIRLVAVSSREFPSLLKRPTYSVLKNQNLKKVGIENLRPWEKALSAYLGESRLLNIK